MGNGPEFFQTIMGRAFFEGTMPALVRELKSLNKNLAKMAEDEEPQVLKDKPEGWLTDMVKSRAKEAQQSGTATGGLVGDYIMALAEGVVYREENEKKKIDDLVEQLLDIEEWAYSIRKGLTGEDD